MPALGTVARTTARGERNPHVAFNDPLENRGWALWHAVRNGKARVKGTLAKGPADRGLSAVSGYTVEINMTTKMRDLWTEFSGLDQTSRASFASELRQYLTISGNAVCLRSPGIGSGDHGQPEWWIRDEWNDVKAVGIFRPTELTSREKRLTPAEAGEDREPAPVEVKRPASGVQDDARRTVVMTNRDRVLAFLKAAKEPVYQREVVRGLQLNTIDVGRILRDCVEKKELFRRIEEKDERPADLNGRFRYLYWDKAKVPARMTPLDSKTILMDMVGDLKPGETLRISWMGPDDKREAREMVEAGLLQFADNGDSVQLPPEPLPAADQQVKTASSSPPEFPAERTVSIPELSPETPEETRVAMGGLTDAELAERADVPGIAGALEMLIEQRVQSRLAERDVEVDGLRARAERAEAALVQARLELSETRRRAEAARAALADLG